MTSVIGAEQGIDLAALGARMREEHLWLVKPDGQEAVLLDRKHAYRLFSAVGGTIVGPDGVSGWMPDPQPQPHPLLSWLRRPWVPSTFELRCIAAAAIFCGTYGPLSVWVLR